MPMELAPVVLTVPLAICTSVKALALTPSLLFPVVVAVLLLIWTKPLADTPCTAGLLLPAVLDVPLTTTTPGPTPITFGAVGPMTEDAPGPGGADGGGGGGGGGAFVWTARMPAELSPSV